MTLVTFSVSCEGEAVPEGYRAYVGVYANSPYDKLIGWGEVPYSVDVGPSSRPYDVQGFAAPTTRPATYPYCVVYTGGFSFYYEQLGYLGTNITVTLHIQPSELYDTWAAILKDPGAYFRSYEVPEPTPTPTPTPEPTPTPTPAPTPSGAGFLLLAFILLAAATAGKKR